jgi:hypothetical protein
MFSKRDGTASRRLWITTAAVGALTTLVSPALAQKVARPRAGGAGDWRLIGTLTANFVADHDSITVKGPFDDFRRVKLRVTGADLEIHHLVITYDRGASEELEVREFIRQGGETRAIDLRGIGRRSVRRIDVWHKTKGILKGKATLVILGMK